MRFHHFYSSSFTTKLTHTQHQNEATLTPNPQSITPITGAKAIIALATLAPIKAPTATSVG